MVSVLTPKLFRRLLSSLRSVQPVTSGTCFSKVSFFRVFASRRSVNSPPASSAVFIVDEVDGTLADERGISPNNPSKCLILGGDGPYIPYRNHSYITPLGPKQALVAIDWRCERKFDQVRRFPCPSVSFSLTRLVTQLASVETYQRLFAAIRALPQTTQHLIVLVGVPIAYPRMVALEALLEKKLNPMSLLAKMKIMPAAVNKFNAYVLSVWFEALISGLTL